MSVSTLIAAHLRGNIIGYLALFVALTGASYAASTVKKNTVISKSIKNGQVKTKDVADGAVTEPKLAFDPATQAELDTDKANLAQLSTNVDGLVSALFSPGTINQADNPVDYSRLKNVPAGFADGVDAIDGTSLADFNNADPTPSVAGVSLLILSMPKTVTALDDGVPGQRVTLLAAQPGSSVPDNTSAFGLAANWNPSPGDTLTLIRGQGTPTWIETSRSGN